MQVYNTNNKSVNHFSQFVSVKVKKNLRKSQAQFWEKLRKLRLRQNEGFLKKKFISSLTSDAQLGFSRAGIHSPFHEKGHNKVFQGRYILRMLFCRFVN